MTESEVKEMEESSVYNEETKEQMERIRKLAVSIYPEDKSLGLVYNLSLNNNAYTFLNYVESKERKDTDWLEYFLRGFLMGVMHGRIEGEKEEIPCDCPEEEKTENDG